MMLNEKIHDQMYYGEDIPWHNSLGVEIEMEIENNFPNANKTNKYWKRERDGSLRGNDNGEYVLRRPNKKSEVFKAIDSLAKVLDNTGTKLIDSVRAGVHVHVNVRDLTYKQMWTMASCWFIIEQLVIETMCGEGRSGNHFCLGASEADILVAKISRVLRDGGDMRILNDDRIRYSALNFKSLFKYGSLEFRAMRTPVDIRNIKPWVTLLLNLKKNSKLYRDPKHLIESFSLGGQDYFLRGLLGGVLAKRITEADPMEWKSKLFSGTRLVQEIAYSIDDWDKLPEKKKKKIPKQDDELRELMDRARHIGIDVGLDGEPEHD